MCKIRELTIANLEDMPIGTTFDMTSKAWVHTARITKVGGNEFVQDDDKEFVFGVHAFHPASNFERIDYQEVVL